MKIELKNKIYHPQRIFCVGRNYVAHAREFNNEVPDKPIIFMKPPTSLVPPGSRVKFPSNGKELHYEGEMVILIGKEGRAVSEKDARSYVQGLSLGLDLTLRDVQRHMKQKGLPWEMAKAFEQSAPVGEFIPVEKDMDLSDFEFTCSVNGEVKQRGVTGLMIFSVEKLIVELSQVWLLRPGDLIYSGTPEGVGPLQIGDKVSVQNSQIGSFSWEIIV